MLFCLVYFVSQKAVGAFSFVRNLLAILLGVFYFLRKVFAIFIIACCITGNMCAIMSRFFRKNDITCGFTKTI